MKNTKVLDKTRYFWSNTGKDFILHNKNGPAIIHANGKKEWYWEGKKCKNEKEWKEKKDKGGKEVKPKSLKTPKTKPQNPLKIKKTKKKQISE